MADREITTIPNGPLGIIALPGCEEMAEKIYELGSEDEARKYFYHIATLKGEKDNKKLSFFCSC